MDSFFEILKTHLRDEKAFSRSLDVLQRGESLTLDGSQGSFFALFGSTVLDSWNRVLLVVTSEAGQLEQIADDFALFTDAEIVTFPLLPDSVALENETDIFFSDDVVFGNRLRCLKKLAAHAVLPESMASKTEQKTERSTGGQQANPSQKPLVIVSSLAALLQRVPSRAQIVQATKFLTVHQEYNRDELVRWLIDGGFHGTSAVQLPGEFSIRGHLVDLFPIDSATPVRLEFWGDEVDSIRSFDLESQRSVESMDSFALTIRRIREEGNESILSHLPNDLLVMFLETDRMIHDTQSVVNSLNLKRSSNCSTDDSALFSVSEIVNGLYRYPVIHSVSFATGSELSSGTFRPHLQSLERFCGNLDQACFRLNEVTSPVRLGIVCQTESEQTRLKSVFCGCLPEKEGRLFYCLGNLSQGFDWEEESLILMASNQLLGRQSIRHPRKKVLSQTIDSFLDLTPGDLVIHVGHGLARFKRLTTITKGQLKEEHLELEFADNVSLYVPASKINLIQRYVGSGKGHPHLAKLNGNAWNRQKKAVQEAVFDMAAEMIELQAKREALHGIDFPPDTPWQQEFEDAFPFRETDDQLKAIDAIKNDMERSRPMDRLLCGDVGFGKTEVAIRAAFKAVCAGYQVAILVPTTVLAEQHYRVFAERLAPYPMSVASLSRFSSKKEQTETIEWLRDGKLDIVIGTQRLVQKDITFSRLGLVIIDEEQKFGVQDKEQLKRFRHLVDVLTMTATPIPRTLHLSLIGVRDISNLETPPDNRLPVETKVVRLNDATIRAAFLRELNRGGQVYFLHNRVKDIDSLAHQLEKIVPEARIRVGHAQMADGELEEVMRDFVQHRFDVLVSTTIIESGLDIPRANTIFINHADRFGLAELHQLRGRVGRDRFQAYCYLLLDANQVVNPTAQKRLNAIEEFRHLGAGFHIAMRDLEIRGAGNILGTQQSGHIALVGYEMYCDFLDSAVRLLKNQPQKIVIDVEVDLPGTAIIPGTYIDEQRTKIDFYKRILRITSNAECQDIQNELKDRFGTLPIEVQRLLLHAQIRIAAFQYRIRSVQIAEEIGERYVMFKYSNAILIDSLQKNLSRRNISLRVISSDQKAYVRLPAFLGKESDAVYPDRLLDFVLQILIEPEYPFYKKELSPKATSDVKSTKKKTPLNKATLRRTGAVDADGMTDEMSDGKASLETASGESTCQKRDDLSGTTPEKNAMTLIRERILREHKSKKTL